jgi:SAM-dependent methyltransferase
LKICSSCATRFEDPSWRCPGCGFRPVVLDGHVAHKPDLAFQSHTGFSGEDFETLASVEEQSFWFRGRNKLITSLLRRHCAKARSLLEIGCGTGFVLRGIADALPQLALHGSEVSVAGLAFAQRRNSSAVLFQMDATDIPYENEFDVIGAFDVLEHIEEDERVLAEIFKALRPLGVAIISVPQHMFLWSARDQRAGHFRRYGARDLERMLKHLGFRIELRSSFVAILLPALYVSRRMTSETSSETAGPELDLPPLVDRVFEWTLDIERRLIGLGVRFPAGGSQLVMARKTG